MKEQTQESKETSVYFFIPNLIGYFRVVTMYLSFIVCFYDPILFFIFYFLSAFSDALDGFFARMYGQSTKFGAVLDMVTDRCSTTGLIMVLSRFYPDYTFFWIFAVTVDLTSHYAHMYCSLSSGSDSHKNVDHPLLAIYYKRYVLFTLCACNEAFFVFFYVLHFYPENMVVRTLLYVATPGAIVKQFLNVVQLVNAFQVLNRLDMEIRHSKSK